jgi:hypothetical protein
MVDSDVGAENQSCGDCGFQQTSNSEGVINNLNVIENEDQQKSLNDTSDNHNIRDKNKHKIMLISGIVLTSIIVIALLGIFFVNYYHNIQYENKSVKIAKDFRQTIDTVDNNQLVDSIDLTPTALQVIINNLRESVNNFNTIDTTKNMPIAKYVASVKKSSGYIELTETIQNNPFPNAGEDQLLGQISEEMDIANNMLISQTVNNLDESIKNILSIQFPDKYN